MINFDVLMRAKFENVLRLAKSLKGLRYKKCLDKPNKHFMIACLILDWNKNHPQKRNKKQRYVIK